MQISVSGKQIDIGDSLRKYVTDHIERVVSKYFDRAINSEVVFSKESHKHGNHFRCDVIVNEGAGIGFIKGNSCSDNIYTSFDEALEKIENRLGKYKSRIKKHHKPKASEELSMVGKGTKYVLSHLDDEDPEQAESDNPVIVAEKTTSIETLTVSEAVMKMDLSDLPALLFKNKVNGRINVVYHREDGNIAWVDPQE